MPDGPQETRNPIDVVYTWVDGSDPRWLERKREALERIIEYYESWNTVVPDTGKAEQAAEWRTELEKLGGS